MADDDLREAVRALIADKNRRFNPEMIAAFAAIFIGVCALVVSVIEVRVLHSQERASFWPYVVMAQANLPEDPTVSFVVINQGTGPAVKQAASVQYKGRYVKSWRELTEIAGGDDKRFNTNGLLSTTALPPGEAQPVFEVPNSPEFRSLHDAINEMSVKLCYCSLLDECWTVAKPGADSAGFALRDFAPKKGACEIPEDQRFQE